MADLLKERRSALPIPKKKRRMTMTPFLLSSVKSCEGGHGLCHHLLEKRGSGLLVLRGEGSMTMAIFFPSLVKSCRGGHGPSSREEEVCSSSS